MNFSNYLRCRIGLAFTDSKVITYGLFIALIASLETLLSIEAIDNLDPEKELRILTGNYLLKVLVTRSQD